MISLFRSPSFTTKVRRLHTWHEIYPAAIWSLTAILSGLSFPSPEAHAVGARRTNSVQQVRTHITAEQEATMRAARLEREALVLEARLAAARNPERAQNLARQRVSLQEGEHRIQAYFDAFGRQSFSWTRSRCAANGDDNVVSAQAALGRIAWAQRCFQQRLQDPQLEPYKRRIINFYQSVFSTYRNGRDAAAPDRGYYPTFGRITFSEESDPENPLSANFTAAPGPYPTVESEPCDRLDGLWIVGFCESGCFAPDQRVRFAGGYAPIATAHREHQDRVVTLSPDATLEHISYSQAPVAYFTVSDVETQHLVEFQTLQGRRLTVTRDHPMVLANGTLRAAETIRESDLLLSEEGRGDPVVAVNPVTSRTRVYNLSVDSESLLQKLVVAEGLVTGTSFYQNEGREYLNRALLRANIPVEVVHGN